MIAKLHDDLARTYYSELARFEKWDEQTLRRKIGQKTFENEFKKEND